MVEATSFEQSLQLFDSVFMAIPQPYRQVDKQAQQEASRQNKKEKGLSLLDLHMGVQTKIKDMQRVNREKSLAKIKELTAQHQAKKASGELTEAQKKKLQEELSESDEEGGDVKMAESKKKVFENKNTVSQVKVDNKRAQKQAIKKIKVKRQAGTKIEPKQGAQTKI